jgi:O-antigen/teichoic acid export membrane protein
MKISKSDVGWNLFATSLRLGVNVIIIPIVMKYLTSEEYGIWTVFLSYGALIMLVDFGFAINFTRNVTYVFGGAKELVSEGLTDIESNDEIDFGLLKGLINAMKYYYSIVSIVSLLIFSLIGTYHLHYILGKGNFTNSLSIYSAWFGYIFTITYQLYTLYYESLIIGRGLVKKQMQIIILAQLSYLFVVVVLVISGFGIISMVVGLMISVFVNRILSKRVFYDSQTTSLLKHVEPTSYKKIINTLSKNSIKVGLTTIGGFLVARASILVGSIYLPLGTIAVFGLTKQLVDITGTISTIANSTYYPRLAYLKVKGEILELKKQYIKNWLFFIFMFTFGSLLLVFLGQPVLFFLKSRTMMLPTSFVLVMLVISFLENNHGWAGYLLLLDNKVPFFKASLICGSLTVILLYVFLDQFSLGVWGLILAPGLAQLYQNWKWPYVIIKNYSFKISDFKTVFLK